MTQFQLAKLANWYLPSSKMGEPKRVFSNIGAPPWKFIILYTSSLVSERCWTFSHAWRSMANWRSSVDFLRDSLVYRENKKTTLPSLIQVLGRTLIINGFWKYKLWFSSTEAMRCVWFLRGRHDDGMPIRLLPHLIEFASIVRKLLESKIPPRKLVGHTSPLYNYGPLNGWNITRLTTYPVWIYHTTTRLKLWSALLEVLHFLVSRGEITKHFLRRSTDGHVMRSASSYMGFLGRTPSKIWFWKCTFGFLNSSVEMCATFHSETRRWISPTRLLYKLGAF